MQEANLSTGIKENSPEPSVKYLFSAMRQTKYNKYVWHVSTIVQANELS